MDKAATEIVIKLAKEFIELMQVLEPGWTKAYYRFRSEEARYGSNASYAVNGDVSLIGALKWEDFYEQMNSYGAQLLHVLGKGQGVFLLTVDSRFDYDIQFEWDDLSRWEITKLNGNTGLPLGM